MAAGPLSIKLRCASWQQLATIYKRDLSQGTMFLKASTPPALGTEVRIDLTLPSASVIVLTGTVDQHLTDPQRGAGVALKLAPIPAQSVWMIESALAAESKRRNTPPGGQQVAQATAGIAEGADVVAAEQDLTRALLSEAESLKKLNPFLVLGVGYEASDADVRAAFGALTKRYHPDLFARYESPKLREVAAEIFILIRDAYRKLGDPNGRSNALAAMGRAPAPRAIPNRAPTPPPIPISPPKPRAQTSPIARVPDPPVARRADATPPPSPPSRNESVTVKPTEPIPIPPEAVRSPRGHSRPPMPTVPMPAGPLPAQAFPEGEAPRAPLPVGAPPPVFEPPEPDHQPVLATAPPLAEASDFSAVDQLMEDGMFDEAIAACRVLAKKHPGERSYRAGIEVCEGLRALAQRDRLEAAQRFEAALEIDPSNERAARELADMRRQATNERKGLLTRLMGKKG